MIVILHKLCCTPQGGGHSSAGGHPGSSPRPGLLVFQEKEWLQNNQGETFLTLLKQQHSNLTNKSRC